MVTSKIDKLKVAVWSIVFPLSVAALIGITMGAPYSSIFGLATLGLVTQIYSDIGGYKYEAFKVYALLPLFVFLLALGGWADQGIR